MTELKAQIDSQFKTEEKIMSPFAVQLQSFLFDTHGIDLSYVSDELQSAFKSKKDDRLYGYKMVVKCTVDKTAFMFKFDAPLTDNSKMSKATYTIQKLIENQEKYGFHMYINCCNFYANAKDTTANSLANLHCLYCDLDGVPDVDFTEMSDREVQDFVAEKYSHVFSVLPFPNYITVSSKAGLHLYFLLNDYAVQSGYGDNIAVWKECGLGLQHLFNVPEFDKKVCKDTQRILRLPGSINIKPNKMFQTRLIKCHGFKKSLSEIRELLNAYIPTQEVKVKRVKLSDVIKKDKKEKKVKVKRESNRSSEDNFKFVRNHLKARYEDLMTWFMSHRNNMDGKRDMFFFILVNTMHYLKKTPDEIRKKVLFLNDMLPEPLPISEIEGSILNYDRRYLIGNYKVAMYLEFTEEEKDSFSGRYVENTEEYERISKKINNNKLTIKRKVERGVHNKKVKALNFVRKNSHLKNAVLAEALGCSVRKVQRLKATVSKIFKKNAASKMAVAINRYNDLYSNEFALEFGGTTDNVNSNVCSQYDDYIFDDNPLLC